MEPLEETKLYFEEIKDEDEHGCPMNRAGTSLTYIGKSENKRQFLICAGANREEQFNDLWILTQTKTESTFTKIQYKEPGE